MTLNCAGHSMSKGQLQQQFCCLWALNRLAGLVVKVSALWAEEPVFDSPLCLGDFSGSSHISDLKLGTPVATLPGAWRYRVSAGTGWPGISILWLGEVESSICNFCLSVVACRLVCVDPSLRYTSTLLGHKATNKQTVWAVCFLHMSLCGHGIFWISLSLRWLCWLTGRETTTNFKSQFWCFVCFFLFFYRLDLAGRWTLITNWPFFHYLYI